jgi:hypothetical protein
MKLDTTLFNAVLEQVKGHGPDEDCRPDEPGEGVFNEDNEVFAKFMKLATALVMVDMNAGIQTAFHIGVAVGLQYAKVSQEVKQLDKLLKGESPE